MAISVAGVDEGYVCLVEDLKDVLVPSHAVAPHIDVVVYILKPLTPRLQDEPER